MPASDKKSNQSGSERQVAAESRLVVRLVWVSIIIHIGVATLSYFNGDHLVKPIVDEWAIDVEVLGDEDGATAIPDVKSAPKPRVQKELLPQLPKTVAVQAPPKDEDVLEVKKAAKNSKPDKPDEPEPEPSKAKQDTDAAVKLKLKELAKRAALEKLRKLKEKENQNQAPVQDPLARIADEVDRNRSNKAAGNKLNRLYGVSLKKRISRHYTLPKTFTSQISDLKVTLAIVVNGKGELVSVKIFQSSSDATFDEYTVKAAQSAAPFDKPPQGLVGRTIHVAFRR